MKFFLVLLLTATVVSSNAQDCTNIALMKKGTQLEYIVYRSENKVGKLARQFYEVTAVTGSAGALPVCRKE